MLRLFAALLALSVPAVAAGAALVACGSANAEAANPYYDSGSDAPGDAPADTNNGMRATLMAVNASPDLGDLRFCVALDGQMLAALPTPSDPAHPMPESNYPGVAAGGGFVLPDIGDVYSKRVTLYAVRADQVTDHVLGNPNARTCDRLVCAQQDVGCLDRGQYFALPELAAGTFVAGSAYVLAVTGCTPSFFDDAGTPARCGADYDSAQGNLKAAVLGVQRPAAMAGRLGVEFVELAPALDPRAPDAGGAIAEYGPLDGDGGQTIADGVSYPGVSSGVAWITLPSAPADYAALGYRVTLAGASAPLVSLSLAEVQKLSNPSALPMGFYGGAPSVMLVLLGDPAAEGPLLSDGGENPAYRGFGLHFIALPSNAMPAE